MSVRTLSVPSAAAGLWGARGGGGLFDVVSLGSRSVRGRWVLSLAAVVDSPHDMASGDLRELQRGRGVWTCV